MVGEGSVRDLECWVRDSYPSEDVVPDPDEGGGWSYAYSRVDNPTLPYSCAVTSDRSFKDAPVTLITRTRGQNEKQTVQRFTFSMMDVDPPTVEEDDIFYLSGGNVYYNGDDKRISFSLKFGDELSGVDITEASFPRLRREQGHGELTPTECRGAGGSLVECDFDERYNDVLPALGDRMNYSVIGLMDNAGNTADPHPITIAKPQGDVTTSIYSPVSGEASNSPQLHVDMSVQMYEGTVSSDIADIAVTVDGKSYSLRNNVDLFRDTTCPADVGSGSTSCIRFSTNIEEGVENSNFLITAQAVDAFGTGTSDSVTIQVDRKAPVIRDSVIVTKSPTTDGMVRFVLDINDGPGSGIERVIYRVSHRQDEILRVEDGSNSSQYFEIPVEDLPKDVVVIYVNAWDNAGNHVTTPAEGIRKNIDAPVMTLDFNDGINMSGTTLHLTELNNGFSVSADNVSEVIADSYRLVFENDGEPIREDSGEFRGGSSVSGTVRFVQEQQGSHYMKLIVEDSIGRTISDFLLDGRTYNQNGVSTIVDFDVPEVVSLTSEQVSMVPENGSYSIDVSAVVKDANLDYVEPSIQGFTPRSISRPDNQNEPHVFNYLLPAGGYDFTLRVKDKVHPESQHPLRIEVEAASIPNLSISSSVQGPMGEGKTLN